MKTITIALLIAFLSVPVTSPAQQSQSPTGDIPIELAKENQFVVKMIDVVHASGKKVTTYTELKAFDSGKKQFTFKTASGKLKSIPAREIKKISFIRLRQGVLTGKSQKLRVIAWNGTIAAIELDYPDVRIRDGYLWLDRKESVKHFKDSGKLRASSSEWSDKFYAFWKRKETEDPNTFAAHFEYKNGKASISRKMAAEYCTSCLRIEILSIQVDHKTEMMRLRCKDFFYDRYME